MGIEQSKSESISQPKKLRKVNLTRPKEFFQDNNYQRLYQEIFSYIPSDTDVYSFARTCRQIWHTFVHMISMSSARYYRLQKLNSLKLKLPKPANISVNLFNNNMQFEIDGRFFATTIEEYEKGLMEEIFFQIVGEVNKKHGPVAFVAGGFALAGFLKGRSFQKLLGGYRDEFGIPTEEVARFQPKEARCAAPHDIDVFLLGKNKAQICDEIVTLMKERFEDAEKFGVFCSMKFGLVNIMVERHHFVRSKSIPEILRGEHLEVVEKRRDSSFYDKMELDKKVYGVQNGMLFAANKNKDEMGQKYYDIENAILEGKPGHWMPMKNYRCLNVFQIICKLHECPSDVFSFFDLDICKIGWFPGLSEVQVGVGFPRAISQGLNYCDLDMKRAGFKHLTRIIKYFHRTWTRTTLKPEPLLSRYHTHPKVRLERFNKRLVYQWNPKQFGQTDHSLNYYKANPMATRKPRLFFYRLNEFTKVFIEEGKELDFPYMAESVGIELNEKGHYYYNRYDFKKAIKEGGVKPIESGFNLPFVEEETENNITPNN